MQPSSQIQQLRGIVPPMVTPLRNAHTPDEQATARLVEHMIAGGVHGLFVLGTSGESVSLGYALRQQFLRLVAQLVAGRIPLLVGITDTSLQEAVQFAGIAREVGATAVVAAPPYYFPTSQSALYQYFRQLSEAIDLPLLIYNIPSHARVALQPDAVLQLMALPNIAGYKDSTADLLTFHSLQLSFRHMPDKLYMVGPEELLAETVLMGAHGGINGGANIYPALYVQLYEAALQRDMERMLLLHHKVLELSALVYSQGGKGKSVIQGIKVALSTLGICEDTVAPPLHELSREEKGNIAAFVRTFSDDIQPLICNTHE